MHKLKAPEEFQIQQWITRRRQEFDGYRFLLQNDGFKNESAAAACSRLSRLMDQAQHVLGNLRAEKITRRFDGGTPAKVLMEKNESELAAFSEK